MKFLTTCLAVCISCALFAQISFQEVSTPPFLDSEAYFNGVSWVDVDQDNDLDVCVSGFKGLPPNWINVSAIYLNDGAGNFSTSNLISSAQKNAMRHGWADIDNDNDLDLYLAATWNQGDGNEIWINNNGSFTMGTVPGLSPATPQPYEGTVSWADYDNDGWVDLFLPRWNNLKNRLIRNNGNNTFADITIGALVTDLAWTSGGYWGDYDNDRDQDIFVVNYQIGGSAPGNNDLFRNDGNGAFTKITTAGPAVTVPERGRSANWVDVNNDGYLDLFVCNQFGQDLLHINNKNGTFQTLPIGDANHTSWSSNWGDYDNDGDQDLITIGFWNTDSRFWQNDGQGNLTNITSNYSNIFPLTTNGSNSNGIVWADADLDGWLDLHITQPDVSPDRFLKNMGDTCVAWLHVKCTGLTSNKAGIGTTIRAKANINGQPVWQMRQVSAQTASTGTNPLWQHFGLQNNAFIDSLVVEWPSGKTCYFTNVPTRQFIEIDEDCQIKTLKKADNTTSTVQEILKCVPADAFQLTMNAPAGGAWSADCGVCIDQNGLFDPSGLVAGNYLVVYQQGTSCSLSIDSFLINLVEGPELIANGPDTLAFGEKAVL
ncbi:MAG: CRTAC1 family protein, partial [Saprospiraceae bacterium]|nr:CRTAC1 family protein [Saprospiraceae bacterium]